MSAIRQPWQPPATWEFTLLGLVSSLLVCVHAGCQSTTHNSVRRNRGPQSELTSAAVSATASVNRAQPLAVESRTHDGKSSLLTDHVVRAVSHTQLGGGHSEHGSTITPVAAEPLPPLHLAQEPADHPVADSVLLLSELELLALANNPAVAEARARVVALHGKWLQVGLPPNTVIGYSGQQLGSGGAAEQRGLYLEQQFIRGGKLELNRQVVCREIEVAEQSLAIQEQRVLTDVRLAYNEAQIAQQRIQLTDQLVEVARQGLNTAQLLLEAREVSRLDVLRAQVEQQAAELAAKNARNMRRAAWTRLSAAAGIPDLPNQLLSPHEQAPGPRIDHGALLAELLQVSPEIAAAAAEIDRARAALRRAIAEPIPDIDVATVTQYDNSTDGVNANVQVTVPIPISNRNQGGIRQARAELAAAERALQRVEYSLRQRLAARYQTYANAHNQVVDYSVAGGILDNARSTLEMVQQGYQAGELDYLDLITAQRTYSQTHLASLESLNELRAAEIELNGWLLRGSLE